MDEGTRELESRSPTTPGTLRNEITVVAASSTSSSQSSIDAGTRRSTFGFGGGGTGWE
jgi:hypothetical protein